jgi:hypothetical protein
MNLRSNNSLWIREPWKLWVTDGPNACLLWLWPDTGKASFALTVVFKGALLVWAASEIACGVNPWRRCLGAGVAGYVLMTIVR